jgi:hypothetical protein
MFAVRARTALLTRHTHTTVNYGEYLSAMARARRPSPIRALQPLFAVPGHLLTRSY